jgi:hypothetical protein
MAVEVGDVVDAVEANPVIATAHGVVAVDALVQTRRAGPPHTTEKTARDGPVD